MDRIHVNCAIGKEQIEKTIKCLIDTCSFVEVNLNKPIKGVLKDFHPKALFKLTLKPGDLIVRKIEVSAKKIQTSDFVSIFRVGSVNENYIAIYPASHSTFEDAYLNGLVIKINLDDVTKLFWI